MKKILLIAAVAGLSMASCKKDKTCTCTYTSNGTTSTETFTLTKISGKDAKDACTKRTSTTTSGSNTSTWTSDCKLS